MKIVVIGGTGLIGSKLVKKLQEHGHEVVAAAHEFLATVLTLFVLLHIAAALYHQFVRKDRLFRRRWFGPR